MSAKKEGFDYFPFSVDLLDDEKLDILREEYGVVVNDVYISLLCLLYKKKGYYIPYETEAEKKDCVWFIYKRVRGGRYPVQQNAIPAVIESLVSQGLFSGRYFPKIITSERAQRTYYSATVERKADSLDINPEYWLLSKEDMEKLSKKHPYYLSCTHFSKSTDLDCKSTDLDCKSTDLPLKESKGNKSKYIPPNPLKEGGGISEDWKERFFNRFTLFERKNYKDDGVNYELLYQEFEKSAMLQKMFSFPKVIKLYENIVNGDFRDKDKPLLMSPTVQAANDRADRERFYAQRKQRAQAQADKALERAMRDSAFKQATHKLKWMQAELARAELNGDNDKLQELTRQQAILYNVRAGALKALGLTEEDLRPRWHCDKCEDSGFLKSGVACSCYEVGRQ